MIEKPIFLMILMLTVSIPIATACNENSVCSYSESLVISNSGNIATATAIAKASAFGATAYAIANVITSHGEAIAIAYAEISNNGKTSTAIAIGGTDDSQESQVNLQASVQTIGGTSAYADVDIGSRGDSGGLVMTIANDPVIVSQIVPVQQYTSGDWSWIPAGMADFDVYKFSVYWMAVNGSDPKPKYNLEILANSYGDGNVSKLHNKMMFFINQTNNGSLTVGEVLTYQQMITDYYKNHG